MNGLIRIFKLFIRVEAMLSTIVDLLVRIESHQQNSLAAVVPVLWLDNQDVMQKLKISESTLKRHRLKGVIRSTRIRGKCYYNDADIQQLLREGVS